MRYEGMTLLVRADAGAAIGSGHLMRCLALAQAWQDRGGQVIFVTACESRTLRKRLLDEGFQVVPLERPHPDPGDWEQTSRVLAMHPGAWVVLDGYHFDSTYQQQVKEAGHRLLVIDDMAHLDHYYADIVLNQNLHAEDLRYSCESYTKLLLGTKYVLLRREFLKWRGWKREIPEVASKVLVTMGGSDPDNVTLKVVQALQLMDTDEMEARVVLWGSSPYFEEVQSAIRASRFPIRLERDVTDMAELMAWADVAISGGGTTCWELAFMGLPSVVLILSDNQQRIAESLGARGVAVNLGWHHHLRPTKIAEAIAGLLRARRMRVDMARRSQQLVDGEGIARVLMHLRGEKLWLRRVREDDCKLLWEWANDPEVRAASFSMDPIPWEEHLEWFSRKLHDPNCLIFIALDDQDNPVGQVRFDVDETGEAEIDVSIDKSKRGSGYGSLLIRRALEEIFRVRPIRTVHAFVKLNNERSVRAFEKANFTRLGIQTIRGNVAIHYVYARGEGDAQ